MGTQVVGEGNGLLSFHRVSRPAQTKGRVRQRSWFGWWGVARVPASALARLLAP